MPGFIIPLQYFVNQGNMAVPEHAVGIFQLQEPGSESFSRHSRRSSTQFTKWEIFEHKSEKFKIHFL